MNKKQRVVVGVALILMGVISFILMASILDDNIGSYYRRFRDWRYEFYLMILLGIIFTGGGIFVLISKEGDFKKRR